MGEVSLFHTIVDTQHTWQRETESETAQALQELTLISSFQSLPQQFGCEGRKTGDSVL